MSDIASNISGVMEEVRQAAVRVNRDVSDIGIVAVTKTVPTEGVREAVSGGLCVLGENRVQELTAKYPLIKGAEWHLIGHLQRNKVKYIADKVSLIHSLDSLPLAKEINRRMAALEKKMDVLIQVNIAEDHDKYGIKTNETADFIDTVRNYQGIKIMGLMTIGPYTPDPEEMRPVFSQLRLLAEKMKTIGFPGVEIKHLSMGMSNDYKVAIEEGATLVRIGSAIFGQRK